MKKAILLLAIAAIAFQANAQVSVNADNSAPDPAAMLDVKSTSMGFLPPRMTYLQRNAISSPVAGLVVWCINCGLSGELQVYNGTSWITLLGMSSGNGCGIYTINHVAGTVAPVTKSTTYGTVTNISGEPFKCWITSNLGATQQATAVNDATEPSAGWYWQFNRKQGYRHDGSTLTPAWTITSINESFDWLTTNDPCNLELGTAWRLPTYSEWYNVDNVGGWTNWNGPWNSGLKLHAAGYLEHSYGSLSARGQRGYYWSGSQYDSSNGWHLHFYSSGSYMNNGDKAVGFSVRCLREN